MKHSHLVRVTRLSHPKAFYLSYAFAFGCRLSHPKAFEFAFVFRLGPPSNYASGSVCSPMENDFFLNERIIVAFPRHSD